MNRRHEPVSSRTAKKVHKEVKSGQQQPSQIPSAEKKTASPSKKPSARKAPTNLTQSHANTEGGRWAEVLRKQTAENELRMRNHELKK